MRLAGGLRRWAPNAEGVLRYAGLRRAPCRRGAARHAHTQRPARARFSPALNLHPPDRLQLLRFGLRQRVAVLRTYFASHTHFSQELCTMASPAWQVGGRGCPRVAAAHGGFRSLLLCISWLGRPWQSEPLS